ncbi:hypothetical protein NQZ79_g8701 [Umbelopsis isabellina]|nr:hypothetical protein NQZ79_g8701 [Umbelopsis isabellina]
MKADCTVPVHGGWRGNITAFLLALLSLLDSPWFRLTILGVGLVPYSYLALAVSSCMATICQELDVHRGAFWNNMGNSVLR